MKKNNVFSRWKERSLKNKILLGLLFLMLVMVLPLAISVLITMFFTHKSIQEVFNSNLVYGLWALIMLGLFLLFLFELRAIGARRVLKVNKDLENSHFMTTKEIESDSGFTVTEFKNLKNVNDGVLISAERIKNRLKVVLHNPIHTLVIATTGTGKTSAYVSPFIEILSRTNTKPCMVITDPKGELYARHANTLKSNGYNVHIINLSMTYRSTLWNPFNDIWRKTERISEPVTQVKNKYQWGGNVYATFSEAEQVKREYTVRLNDEIYVDLQDLIYTACPVESAQDKTWQQGARDLIFAVALRMWEDLRDGYLPKEKFNLYNLWWNINEYARGDCSILKEYIDECADEVSRASSMGSTVLVSEDRTLSSYLGSVNQYMHWLADGGVVQLTSGNEIEFSEWDEDANVLFIKIPDAKEGRHGLVALMLVQLYKALLEKATKNSEMQETSDERLKRNCYFLMDEFGSLPKIQKFEQIVTIARSRKIFLMPVIQSYNQLDSKYGQNDAGIIKDNCNIRIFMGTNDEKTRNEISEACGKHKVKSVSYSESKDMSVSTSAQSVPLIYPSELKNLNNPSNGVFGNAVVLVAETFPIRGKTTPYFKAQDIYGIEEGAEVPKKDFMIFDEQNNRYDILKLIYLNRSLNDNETERAVEEVKVDNKVVDIKEVVEKKKKTLTLDEQIEVHIKKLKGKISAEEFSQISKASLQDKIQILDLLAENITNKGNIFLAMEIEHVLSFLHHCQYNESGDNSEIK